MHESILATASRLSDDALLARVKLLAGRERVASVELIAHLAELEGRTTVYLGAGVKSLYRYCTEILHLSEHAAYNRIGAARAARKFPVILDLLADGSVNVTTVTILAPHLTAENHRALLEQATHRTKEEVEVIKARLAPRPDVPASIRKLPVPVPVAAKLSVVATEREDAVSTMAAPPIVQSPPPPQRPVVEPLTPERYRLQFTVGKATHDTLRRLQNLLAREIPDGDPAAIVDRALTLLLKDVEKKKLGAVVKPRTPRPTKPRSRHVPAHIRRAVNRRDGGRCAFLAKDGRRCTERKFLEWHHLKPYAPDGQMSVANISLRCRAHNVYEAELIFGRFDPSLVRETPADYMAFGNGSQVLEPVIRYGFGGGE